MRTIKSLGALLLCALSASPVMAQQTYEEMEQLTVNEQVTTVITASEPVRFVDISTDKRPAYQQHHSSEAQRRSGCTCRW